MRDKSIASGSICVRSPRTIFSLTNCFQESVWNCRWNLGRNRIIRYVAFQIKYINIAINVLDSRGNYMKTEIRTAPHRKDTAWWKGLWNVKSDVRQYLWNYYLYAHRHRLNFALFRQLHLHWTRDLISQEICPPPLNSSP